MKKIISTGLLLLAIVFSGAVNAQEVTDADKLIGIWEPSHGKAKVKVEKIGEKYYGKIVWLREPIDPETNGPKLDKNNPDENLQNKPLRGFRILKDFQFTDKNEWTEGTIYDPENGNTYSCIIKMTDDNTLDIRGYIGVSVLGRTDIWKRLKMPPKKK
ncbi:DUF2147 domain-containing protein [Vicingaceae bacterium]|nr:DUF2147 domain-containing protein [Vicingaceae bacterium]